MVTNFSLVETELKGRERKSWRGITTFSGKGPALTVGRR